MNTLSKISIIALIISSLALIATYFLPLWRIDLWAPQYPEGLAMFIWLNKLSGDVEIINGLNHYIGMAHIKEEMFPEFKILPYVVAFYIAFGLLTAFLKSKKMLFTYLILIVLAGIIALYDFWQWGYEYGHNLSDDAAIKVPGMAYQPPLIGYKELLNFGAYSIPAAGGWVFIAVGVVVAVLVAYEFYFLKKSKTVLNAKLLTGIIVVAMAMQACAQKPEPINYGKDACHFCKMTIVDKKFASEIVTDKGKVFKFDDVGCMVKYMKTNNLLSVTSSLLLVNDYTKSGELIDATKANFFGSKQLRSPMRGDVAAMADKAIADAAKAKFDDAKSMTWQEIIENF